MLDRSDMDHFATIFLAYQKRGKAQDPEGTGLCYHVRMALTRSAIEIRQLDEQLAPWRKADALGKIRANPEGEGFTIK